jgi:tRNA-Thr(GGU) m(6)t(6)A37 methyltransferase TsaA
MKDSELEQQSKRVYPEITRSSELPQVCMTAIGIVENDVHELLSPSQIKAHPSRIIVDPALEEGLDGLMGGQRLLVVFQFHLLPGYELHQHPKGDPSLPKRGVFALHSPRRPNPIGVTEVDLLRREGNILHVSGLDAVNGTPVLDLKLNK